MNERVLEVRKSLKLTQREFGARLGVKDNAISRIESGERGLTEQMILAICREFNVHEHWLRTGEGGSDAMFEEYDDANIAALVSRYGLDALSQTVLKAYVKIPADKRKGVNAFISYLAQAVMEDRVTQLKFGVFNEVYHANIDEGTQDSLVKEVHSVFNRIAPPIKNISPPPPTASRLQALIHNNDVEFSGDSAAPALSIEEQADMFAARAREQFLLEKKQVTKASSVNESGVV